MLCIKTLDSIRKSFNLLSITPLVRNDFMSVHHHKERPNLKLFLGIIRSNRARANRNTHVNERKFRKLRGRKTAVIELPEDSQDKKFEEMTPEEMRKLLLKKGINPYKKVQPRVWDEQQITFNSTFSVADPYVVPEKPLPIIDPSAVLNSAKEKYDESKDRILNNYRNYRHGTLRIRRKQGFEKFDPKVFGSIADKIYVEAHKALIARDKKLLHKYITAHAFQKMWPDVEKGSIFWELVEYKDPSRVVTVRCVEYPPDSGNDIAQITVRMHSTQKIAVFDRFGRLILGSETEIRPVLEYVVFENHVASLDGSWRLHDKIYPEWVEPKQSSRMTTVIDDVKSRPEKTIAIKPTVMGRKKRSTDKD